MDVNRISGYIPGKMVFFLMQVRQRPLQASVPSKDVELKSESLAPPLLRRAVWTKDAGVATWRALDVANALCQHSPAAQAARV